MIKLHRKGTPQRELARAFGVSRRLVSFIIYPERLAIVKAQYKERRKDGRYYHKEAVQNYRAHLRETCPSLANNPQAKSRKAKMGKEKKKLAPHTFEMN